MASIRKHLSGQKGFTLIELLVVVAILGILAGIAVPRVMDAIDNARAKKADADLTVIRDALERFYLEYGVFPPSLDYLVANEYIDPNFTFKNSYGNIYFYAVLWNETEDPAHPNLSDYVLGDPGKVPLAAGTYDADEVCQGLYDATNHTAYAWGTWASASPLNVTKSAQNVMTGATVSLNARLTLLTTSPTTKPVSTAIKYKGQNP